MPIEWDSNIWDRLYRVEKESKWLMGPKEVHCDRNEFVILSNIRNAELWLTSFFSHHDRLRPKHYFFFDNGSTDRTIEILKSKSNVTIVQCDLSWDQYYADFFRFVLWKFSDAKWALWVDQDQQFDYPGSSIVEMSQLLIYLNRYGYNAVRTHAVDMFADTPLTKIQSLPDDDLRIKYPLCDLSDLWANPDPWKHKNFGSGREIPYLTGGIRKKAFGTDWIYLTFHALIYDGKEIVLSNGHSVSGAHIADFSAMVWHYKFLDNFFSIANELYSKWKAPLDSDSALSIFRESKAYVDTIMKNSKLNLATRNSVKLHNVDDLLTYGVLQVSKEYIEFVRSFIPEKNREKMVES